MSGVNFRFHFISNTNFLLANSVDPDQMPHFVASDLGLHCLPRYQNWDARLTWVNNCANNRRFRTSIGAFCTARQPTISLMEIGNTIIYQLFQLTDVFYIHLFFLHFIFFPSL